MSFESGKISVRAFHLIKQMPENLQGAMRSKPVPPDEVVMESPASGWVVQEDLGGYKRAVLRSVQRKISTVQLKKEVLAECKAYQQANNVAYVSRKLKNEITAGARARLLPLTPVTSRDIELVWAEGAGVLYASAMSGSQVDLLCNHMALLQCPILQLDAENTAMARDQFDCRKVDPAGFTTAVDPVLLFHGFGSEFLTWLWFRQENYPHTSFGDDALGILLEGPLTLSRDGAASETTTLKGGAATISTETKACLLDGKVLVKGRFSFTCQDQIYQAVVDNGFGFRGLAFSTGEGALDAGSRFQSRIVAMEQWFEMFFGLYANFIGRRSGAWDGELEKMQLWVSEKKVRG
jgi:hypothetical protein